MVVYFTAYFTNEHGFFIQLLWVIPIIGGWIWGLSEIIKSEKFKGNMVVFFLITFIIILPLTEKSLDLIKGSIYSLNDGVASIEIKESTYMFFEDDETYDFSFRITLMPHNELNDDVIVELSLPEEAKAYFKTSRFVYEQDYSSLDMDYILQDSVTLKLKNGVDLKELSRVNFNDQDYEITLIVKGEKQVHIRNDAY
jgi:hypothetical protein